MARKRIFVICILLLVVVLLGSCKKATEKVGEINLTNQESYPVLSEDSTVNIDSDQAYPIETHNSEISSLPETLIIPNASANSGVVFGMILSLDSKNSPYVAPDLYLGAYLRPDGGDVEAPLLVGISPDEDPKALKAQDGTFVFVDVPPGTYGLFIYTPMSAFLMTDAKTGEYVNIQVEAGQLIDLGTLYVK